MENPIRLSPIQLTEPFVRNEYGPYLIEFHLFPRRHFGIYIKSDVIILQRIFILIP